MKWNLKKVLALSGALVLIGGLAWFSNALNGNLISKMLAQSTAERYLAEHYGDTDYYIDRVSYNFKDGNYHAFVRSPSSVDTTFTLSLTMLGSLQGDTYDHVLSGWNTALRLDGEYRALADRVLEEIGSLQVEMTQNWNRRYRENMERLKSGDLFQVARVVKGLMLRDVDRGLSTGERKMLHSAKQILISEIVMCQSSSYEAVEERINRALA